MAPDQTVIERLKAAKLTPLQDALIDSLIARYRLGEVRWSIASNKHTRAALNVLAELGALTYQGHNASTRSVYVYLTEETIAVWAATGYTSPLEKKLEQVREDARIMRDMLVRSGVDLAFLPKLR